MHMADALITPIVAGAMYVSSGTVLTYSVKKIRPEEDLKKVSLMGILGAFVFSAQMINFTIPGTGSSGHFCGALLLAALLGPYAAFLTMAGVLLIQCLLFADGGLLALGCNIWNMSFYGCFIGGSLIWNMMTKKKMTKSRIIVSSMLGSIISLQLGAFSVVLETLASGVTELPFNLFVMAMQPIHLAIGVVEGLITSAVLCFIYSVRPEILWHPNDTINIDGLKAPRISFKSTLTILSVATLVIGGLFSLFASTNPDGLEWSIAQMPNITELTRVGATYEYATAIQNQTALLPDYAFKGSDSILGTSFSGIVGCLLVTCLCVLFCFLVRLCRKKKKLNNTAKQVYHNE